jgi:hypothetical protein
MRHVTPIGLAAAVMSISCQAFDAGRSFTVLMAMLAAALAWVAHRGQARAGGDTGATGTDTADTGTADTGTADTGTADTGTADSGTTATSTADSGTTDSGTTATATTATATDGSSSSTGSTGADEAFETGPCLSAPETETDTEAEMTVCLCACETGKERDGTDLAPALLLPVIVQRRRSRRQSLERIAADGRLPSDVIARLRLRIDASD